MGKADRLLADGCCGTEYKSSSEEPPLLFPMGGGSDRQRGVSSLGESIRCVCMCV